jgi:L-threonylcarbamoyladenylate synthase
VTDPIDEAAAAARDGRLIVMPTDTVYGVGTRPDDPAATSRLFAAKGRPRELELPVLVADRAEAERIAVFDDRALELVSTHWPGALTTVLPRSNASAGWDLGGDPGTIGVRVPNHPMARELLARTGPLAVTSANRSGRPTPATCREIVEVFGDKVEVYLCQPDPLPGLASTVVDLTGERPRVLRRGSVEIDEQGRRADG